MEHPRRDSTPHAMRDRLDRLREDLSTLSNAIREELDWRDKLYPIADDEDDERF